MLKRVTSVSQVSPGKFVYPAFATKLHAPTDKFFFVDRSGPSFSPHFVLEIFKGKILAINPAGSVGMFVDNAVLFSEKEDLIETYF